MKNTVTESHILPVVEDWADSLIGEIPEIAMTSEESSQLEAPDTLGEEDKTKTKATSPSDTQKIEQEMPSSTTQLSPFPERTHLDSLNQEVKASTSTHKSVGDVHRQVCAMKDLDGHQNEDEDKHGVAPDEDSDATIDVNMSNDEGDVDNTKEQNKWPESENKTQTSGKLPNSMSNPDSGYSSKQMLGGDSGMFANIASSVTATDQDPQPSEATTDHVGKV